MPHGSGASQKHAPLQDLELAKKTLQVEGLSLTIVKENEVLFKSRESGVKSLVEAVGRCGSSLEGAAAADRVVGKAAAFICVHAKLSNVYAHVMSRLGEAVLKRHSIPSHHNTLVPNILNRLGTDMCPFEKIVLEIDSPEEAFQMISHRLQTAASPKA